MSENHDSMVWRTLGIVLTALLGFMFLAMFVANIITGNEDEAKSGSKMYQAAVAERIKPVGEVNITGAATEAPATAAKSGSEIVAASCNSCHGSGVLGAPKVGDKAAWQGRMANGLDALVTSAINGKGAMPPRGGAATLSDDEIRAAIEHMLSKSGVEAGAATAAPAAAATESKADTVTTPVTAAADMMSNVMNTAAESAQAVATAVTGPDLAEGKALYTKSCFACHGTGAAGAPVLGNRAAWGTRIAQGVSALNDHAINGFKAMPPKGGSSLSDNEIKNVVAYMIAESK